MVGGSRLGTAETHLPIPTRRQSRHSAGQTKGMSGRLPTLPIEVTKSALCWLASGTEPPQGGGSGEQLWQEAGPSFTGRLHGAGLRRKRANSQQWFPLSPSCDATCRGGTFFSEEGSPGILSFNPCTPKPEGIWVPSQETCSAMRGGRGCGGSLTSRWETWAPDQGETLASHRTSPPPCPRSEKTCFYSDFPGCVQEPQKLLGGDREGEPQIFLKR